jgi:enoyl-CoA hydratase/carnithine racemase
MDLMLTARDVDAEEALRIGLAAAVFPDDGFRESAQGYAAALAANAPIGMTHSKRLLVEALENPFETQLKREVALIRKCFATEDFQEGLRAFMERRKPEFKGR